VFELVFAAEELAKLVVFCFFEIRYKFFI